MGLRFIFMLTRNDRTVPDASQTTPDRARLGVRHIGFKDIGLPLDQLKALNAAIKAGGATSYLEVVSLDRESEIVSARQRSKSALTFFWAARGSMTCCRSSPGHRYRILPVSRVGSPVTRACWKAPSRRSSRAPRRSQRAMACMALTCWPTGRRRDVPELMKAVCAAVSKPVYIAGSIDTPERIAVVQRGRRSWLYDWNCGFGRQIPGQRG